MSKEICESLIVAFSTMLRNWNVAVYESELGLTIGDIAFLHRYLVALRPLCI